MKFVMVTTFFGAHSFGGDAAYVDRLSRALARRGHEVDVVHCVDAFNVVKGRHPLRPYAPPPGVRIHSLRSRWGWLSPLASQVSGRPWLKSRRLRALLDENNADVAHFHNISLIGGPGILTMGRQAIRVMTAHEHWLTCPMHLLWKNGRQACDRPTCVRCCVRGGRPPQVWRSTSAISRGLGELDALLFPSQDALLKHASRGLKARRMGHLPYFLPDDWTEEGKESAVLPEPEASGSTRPYLAAAGRLVAMKGFQRLIPMMKWLPQADLRIAGTGPFEGKLRKLAEGLPNVRFEGLLGAQRLAGLFAGARAVVVPSLFPETFGYVVLEAYAARTPVIVNLDGGALAETGVASGGGLGYRTDAELLLAMRRMVHDDDLRARHAERGYQVRSTEWSESVHVERYLGLIEEIRAGRTSSRKAHPAEEPPPRSHFSLAPSSQLTSRYHSGP